MRVAPEKLDSHQGTAHTHAPKLRNVPADTQPPNLRNEPVTSKLHTLFKLHSSYIQVTSQPEGFLDCFKTAAVFSHCQNRTPGLCQPALCSRKLRLLQTNQGHAFSVSFLWQFVFTFFFVCHAIVLLLSV